MKMTFTTEEDETIKNNYGKLQYQVIAKMVNTDWMSVRHRAKRLGIVTPLSKMAKRRFSGRKPISINHSFFNVSNPLNCYWAGFLAADGNLTQNGLNKIIRLKLAIKDEKTVRKFKKDLEYLGQFFTCMEKHKYRNETRLSKQCFIKFTSQPIFDALEKNFNITPRKTFTLKFPDNLNTPELFFPFIVGYIDGDGCIRKNGKNILILGNEGFLLSMKQFLSIYGIDSQVSLKQSGQKIHKLCINKDGTYKLFDYAYKYFYVIRPLKRKWDRIANNFPQNNYLI